MTRLARFLSIFTLLHFFAFYALFISPSPALAAAPQTTRSWQVKPQAEWERIIKQCDNPGTPQLASECYSGPYSLGNLLQTLLLVLQGSTTGSSPGLPAVFTSLYATILFSQPSSLDYVAYVGQNLDLSFVKPAYAQGVGFSNFQPLVGIWTIFRNLAYLIFVLILIVIGFMVMFRRKLDPQTVVGIQQALPRIVIALLLVTFSYAIVGFMVDLMVLSVSTIAIFLSNKFSLLKENIPAILATTNLSVFELINPIKDIGLPIAASIEHVLGELLVDIPVVPQLLGSIIKVIFQVALVFSMFKIFFMLLENYIHIILSIIFGPLQLSLAAIPGNKTIRSWIMSLLSHILIFPATFTLIFIASLFAAQGNQPLGPLQINSRSAWHEGEPSWAPPLMGGALQQQRVADPNRPEITPGQNLVGPLIAFGIILVIPQIGSVIKSQFEVKELPAGESISQQLGRGAGWIPGVGGLAQRALSS